MSIECSDKIFKELIFCSNKQTDLKANLLDIILREARKLNKYRYAAVFTHNANTILELNRARGHRHPAHHRHYRPCNRDEGIAGASLVPAFCNRGAGSPRIGNECKGGGHGLKGAQCKHLERQ